MAKKFFPRALSVGLSLALCAGMVAPAFAHVVVIDGVEEAQTVDTVQAGVDAIAKSESKSGSITMTENETGTAKIDGGVNVTLDMDGNTLNGDGKGSVITVKGENTSLTVTDNSEEKSGTITGGSGATFGGGIHVTGGASATLENGNITKNAANANGGGVYVENGSFTMNGGTISGNNGGNVGGGVYVNTQAALMQKGEATFEMNGGTISDNYAGSGGGVGAGSIDRYDNTGDNAYAAIDINGGSITSNHATTGDGGGVWAKHDTVEISDAVISENTAANIGGGVYLGNCDTTITDSTITSNHVKGTTANGGGGIYAGGGTANISGTEISGNTSTTNGGGISGDANMTLNDVTIKDNHADNGRGGGIYTGNSGTLEINGGEISQNSANLGGGVFAFANLPAGRISKVTVDGTKITGNSATKFGGGIYVFSGAELALNDGVVYDNSAANGGGVFVRNAAFTMNGGKLYGNKATANSADLYSDNKSPVTLIDVSGMGLTMEDGTPITGWLWDGSPRWSADSDENHKYQSFTNYTGNLYLKAAHDKYYNVSYMDGETVLQSNDLEKGEDIPVYSGEMSRPGYTFAGWLVGGEEFDPITGTVGGDLVLVALWTQNPVVIEPETPDLPDDTDETEIDDQAIPLAAGPVTRAEFIDYLWRHEGEPASDGVCTFTDVPEDHQFVLALAWAEQNGIAEAYLGAEGHEDGTFEPDELVTVGDVREFLGSFAGVFGTNAVVVDELTTLASDDGEAVLNCDQVLAEFFGEEYTPANTKNDELDIAA